MLDDGPSLQYIPTTCRADHQNQPHVEARPSVSPRQLTRIMLTATGPPCPFGCTYCFADFDDYSKPQSVEALRNDHDGISPEAILYPACDIDLFARRNALSLLDELLGWRRHISVSTKATLPATTLSSLGELAHLARMQGTILKIGVSIVAKAALAVIEPRTPPYAARLRLLGQLRDAGVCTAVILRPLLVDVPREEIAELLEECRVYTNLLLIGEEYIGPSRPRVLTRPPETDVTISRQAPTWAPHQTAWKQRTSAERRSEVLALASALEYEIFNSDLELMASLIAAIGGQKDDRCIQSLAGY